jgi:hypothetical protein
MHLPYTHERLNAVRLIHDYTPLDCVLDAPSIYTRGSTVLILGRYFSYSSGDAVFPFPTYETISDRDINNFYYSRRGGKWDRRYTLISTKNPELATMCGLYDPTSTMLLDFEREPLGEVRSPSIVLRNLLPRSAAYLSQGQNAYENVDLRSRLGVARNGGDTGDLEAQAEALAGQFYPHVEIFSCDPATGHLVQLY